MGPCGPFLTSEAQTDLCNSFCELTLPRPRTDYLKRSVSYIGTFCGTRSLRVSEESDQWLNLKSESILLCI